MIKSSSKLFVLLGALALSLSCVAPTAMADTSYEPSAAVSTSVGSGNGELTDPQDVAVESSTGNVFVSDRGNDRIEVFAPDGGASATYLTQFGAGVIDDPTGITIDQSTGAVYVSDADDIVKFVTDGAATPTFTQDVFFSSPGVTGPLGFDDGNGWLVVADATMNVIRRYTALGVAVSGAAIDGSSSGAAYTGLRDVTVQDDGDIVAVDADRVVRVHSDGSAGVALAGLPGYPSVVAAVPGTDNLLVGQSGGYTPDFATTLPSARLYRYPDDSYTGTTVLPAESFQGLFGLDVGGDASGALYVVTGASFFGEGAPSLQRLAPFAVQPPVVSAVGVEPSTFGARLTGDVDTNRDQTRWMFEYGKTSSYGQHFPVSPAVLDAGSGPVSVAAAIGGLEASTTYHYRLTATNAGGTTTGADRTFSTSANASPEGNDDSRAYELVSSSNKYGNDVKLPGNTANFQASASGERIAFPSDGAFEGAVTSLSDGYLLAQRGAKGWAVRSVELPQEAKQGQIGRPTRAFSSGLTRSVTFSTNGLTDGATSGGDNIYVQDLDTGDLVLGYTAAANVFRDSFASFASRPPTGASDDLSHFAFGSSKRLVPEAPNGGVFEVADGALRIVSRLPDGTVSDAATMARSAQEQSRFMSVDGRRILFQSRLYGPLYMRVDGERTVLLSRSHRSGDDPTLPLDGANGASLIGMSNDGSIVYFGGGPYMPPLTDEVNAAGCEIYRYLTETDALSCVLGGVNGFLSMSPLATSQDGRTLYFASSNSYAAGAVANRMSIYALRDDQVNLVGSLKAPNTTEDAGPVGGWAASPNGRFFAFGSDGRSTGEPNGGSGCVAIPSIVQQDGACHDVFVYDAQSGRLDCASCLGGGSGNRFSTMPTQAQQLGQYVTRAVSDDGAVFFDSAEALSPSDTNGDVDVYEWGDGEVRLISSGQGQGSRFADASADGKTVFFATRNRLVDADVDTSRDLYAARVGGGFDSPGAPRDPQLCVGDACQPAASSELSRRSPDVASNREALDGWLGAPAVRARFSGGLPNLRAQRELTAGKQITVKVTVSGAGRVSLSARARVAGRVREVAAATKVAKRAGVVSLKLKLSAGALRQLRRSRSLRVTFEARFAGVRHPRTSSVTLRPASHARTSRPSTNQKTR